MSGNHSYYPAPDGWCQDQLKFNSFSYTWTINYFSFRENAKFSSAIFSAANDKNNKWQLELDRKCYDFRGRRNYTSLYLVLVASKNDVRAKFKLSLLNGERKTLAGSEFKSCQIMEFSSQKDHLSRHGNARLLETSALTERDGYLCNDTLTILCEVDVLEDAVLTTWQQPQVNVPECHLSGDLATLLQSQDFTDCTLHVGGTEFKVHKNILSARSPVFAAMFKHGMIESRKNSIHITDIHPCVMPDLIHFIYTGSAPNLDQFALHLLGAADKYQLDRLKAMCEDAMYGTISPANACDRLVVSHLHSANQLKAHAIRCINAHADAVVATDGWNDLVNKYPQLMAEVFKAKNS